MRAKNSYFLSFTLIIWLFHCGFFDSAKSLNKQGNEHFQAKRYQSALESYQNAQIKNPDRPEILYNLGTTLYQINQYQHAATLLKKSMPTESLNNNELLALNWYNYGNVQYRLGNFDEAIDAYKNTLDVNPNDKDAKHNLELLLQKKNLFEKEQQERNQNQDKQKKDRPKQQDDSQSGSGSESLDQNQPEGSMSQDDSPEEGIEKSDRSDSNEDKQNKASSQDLNQPSDVTSRENQASDTEELQPVPYEKRDHYLQGQMSQEDAYRILDALKDAEQDIQIIRKPSGNKRRSDEYVEQDW